MSVPEGWEATSGNAVQKKRFYHVPGSPSGLWADELLEPVGIAPIRSVRGHLVEGAAATVNAFHGGKRIASEDVSGDFKFLIPEEVDRIVLACNGLERELIPSPYPLHLGLLGRQRGTLEPEKKQTTIAFDDLTTRGLRKIPSGYAGLNWLNLNVVRRDFLAGSQGYVNGATSGEHTVYTSGASGEIWSDAPFDFIGAMLSAAWLRSEGETGKVECWRGEDLIAVDLIPLSALTPVHYMPLVNDVTRVRFSTEHYWQMVIDDLTIAR